MNDLTALDVVESRDGRIAIVSTNCKKLRIFMSREVVPSTQLQLKIRGSERSYTGCYISAIIDNDKRYSFPKAKLPALPEEVKERVMDILTLAQPALGMLAMNDKETIASMILVPNRADADESLMLDITPIYKQGQVVLNQPELFRL